MNTPSGSSSVTGSIRRLADTLLGTISNRLELLGLELQEERYWLLSTFIWVAAALFLSFTAIVTVTFTIVFVSPDSARPWVLLGFAVFYVLAATGAGLTVRRRLMSRRPPFADSLSEFKKDVAAFQPKKEE